MSNTTKQSENPFSNIGEQIVNISKASAFDIVSQQVKELQSENEALTRKVQLLREAVEVALWSTINGEAEAQRQGKPRLSERCGIFRKALKETE